MPIDYQRDDSRRLITVTITEPFSFADLVGQTDRQWREETWEYAVLYDSRAAWQVRPPHEIQQQVDHTQAVGGGRPRGPVGVAIPPRPDSLRGGLELADRSGAQRDIEILLNVAQVDAWFARHALRRGPS